MSFCKFDVFRRRRNHFFEKYLLIDMAGELLDPQFIETLFYFIFFSREKETYIFRVSRLGGFVPEFFTDSSCSIRAGASCAATSAYFRDCGWRHVIVGVQPRWG